MLALALAASLTCPSGQIIGLDLKAWKASFLKDAPGSDEQRADMAAIRMKTVPEGSDSEADCMSRPVVEGVDVFDANLTGAHDKLVQVRFRLCKGSKDEWQSLRFAPLVPRGEKWCLLDGADDLGVDRALSDRPCDKPGKLPMTLAFKALLETGSNVVETRDEQGTCSDEGHATKVTLALWQAQGAALKKIFEAPIYEAGPTGGGRHLVQRWAVSYGKAFPKSIHLERTVEGTEGTDSEDYAYSKSAAKYVAK